ncbi:hypothetical protein M407DRAFT_4190 [Tulasnella calospora MUT 4182]|uniref:Methyltransferase domain-containing protein n=1 Tax=Tulasnella calospora MUT 4182 TaxID=1051891 RepID=A0A0C3QU98_9AGAM|nr:hypothetical protein M407DRAFT_4190 [Tulasnella calospora MUT 4182]
MASLNAATTVRLDQTRNHSFSSIERVDEIVKEMGDQTWESVSSASIFMPVGDWSADPTEREAGGFIRQSLLQALTSTRPLLLTHGLGVDEVDQLSEELRSELNENKCPQYLKGINVWAVKATVRDNPGSSENTIGQPAMTHSLPLRQLYGQAVNPLTDLYLMAGDAAEHTRLDAQHGAITLTLGGLFPGEAQDVIQTAFGLQTLQSRPEPPSNCRFEVCDVNVNLDRYPSNSFNVVHARAVLQGIEDHPSFFRQVARLLRPGGVFVSVEPGCAAFDGRKNRINATKPDDPGFTWFHRMATFYRDATMARNPSLASVEQVDGVLQDLGDSVWCTVSNTSAFVPVGAWSTDRMFSGRFSDDIDEMSDPAYRGLPFSDRETRSRGFSAEDVEQLTKGLRAELTESRVEQYMKGGPFW